MGGPRVPHRQEIMALYDGPLNGPAWVLPVLVEMAGRHAGTRPGEWAAWWLASLRKTLWEDVRDDTLGDYSDYQRSLLGWGQGEEEDADDGES